MHPAIALQDTFYLPHQESTKEPDRPIVTVATLQDIDELIEITSALLYVDQFSHRRLHYLAKNKRIIVARLPHSQPIVGYAVLLSRKNSHNLRIYALCVAPSAQNIGVGTAMLLQIQQIAVSQGKSTVTLEVFDHNLPAIALYRKCGFHQCGFHYNYYEDGGHALLMRKNLHRMPTPCRQ